MDSERAFVSHHGELLFQLPNPSKTTCSYLSNWVYDDDIDMDTNKDDSSPQGTSRGEGGTGCSGPAPHKEMLEPPMTMSHNAIGASGFNEAHFY